MPSCSPPLWVSVLQALATPAIAVVGAWIAFQQMHIARVKLQHDLYDRRYAVFQAVRRFLGAADYGKPVPDETFRSFRLGTSDAAFLFDDGLAAYLEDMLRRAATAQSIYMSMDSLQGENRARAAKVAGEYHIWLMEQVGGLTEKFQPFLKLDRCSRSARRFPRFAWLCR